MQVTFPDGVSSASITLTVSPDEVAELNEVTLVTLTDVVENGVPPSGDQTRGATIASGQSQAVITVQANDDPHGVVSWSPLIVRAEELEEMTNNVQLIIVREFGTVGAIIISYTTAMDTSLPDQEQAVSLQDFIPTSSDVVIGDGETSANVSVSIIQVCSWVIMKSIPSTPPPNCQCCKIHCDIYTFSFRTILQSPMNISLSTSPV